MEPEFTPLADLDNPEDEGADPSQDLHLTTFAHEGRFWDVHVEFVEDPRHPDSCRARLRFVPTDQADEAEPARTAVIIIEPTCEEAMRTAKAFGRHHLAAMLRSVT